MKAHKYISAIAIVLTLVLYLSFKPSPLYSETLGFDSAKMLSALSIFNYPKNMSDKNLASFLKEETNKEILFASINSITGASIDFEGNVLGEDISIRFFKSGNIDSYTNLLESVSSLEIKELTASDSYRLLLEVLGYGPLKDLSPEEVLGLAKDVGFAYLHEIEDDFNITNGDLANILLESLYLNEKDAKIPLIHILADINPDLRDKALSLNMIDIFPEDIPQFVAGSYKIGSFTKFIGANKQESEYSAKYLNVNKIDRDNYLEKLLDYGFILETELIKENDGKEDLLSLHYIIKDGHEYYVTVIFNEDSKTLDLWYGY